MIGLISETAKFFLWCIFIIPIAIIGVLLG